MRSRFGSALARNIVYNLLGQALLLGISLLAARYIFRLLGAEIYGVISFTLVLNSFIVVALDLGITATTTREISISRDRNPAHVVILIRTASTVFYCLFVLGAVAIWFAAPWLSTHVLRLNTLPAPNATLVLRVLGVATLTALPRGLYASVLRGMERMGRGNLIDVGSATLQQLGVALVLIRGGSLLQVVGWIAFSNAVALVAYAIVVAGLFSVRTLLPGFSRTLVRQSRRFSLQMTALSILSVLHTEADQLIVVKLLPVGTFGFYTFTSNLAGRGSLVTGAISLAALPSLSSSLAGNDRAESLRQYRKLQDLMCLGMVPVFAAIIFCGVPVLTFVFNRAVADMMLAPLALICLGNYLNATLTVPYLFSVADDRARIALTMNLLALVAVVPVSVLLVMRLGVLGAGLSWVVYHLFAYAYMVPRVARRCLSMTAAAWYFHVSRIAAAGGITYGLAWLAVNAGRPGDDIWLAVGFAVASLGFVGSAYALAGSELRDSILHVIGRPRQRPILPGVP